MSDQLQQQLAKVLDTLLTAAQSGAAWVGEQLPPLVQEIVLLGRVQHTLWTLAGLAIVGWALLWAVKIIPALIKEVEKTETASGEEGSLFGVMLVGTILTLISTIWGLLLLYREGSKMIAAWVAPRIYLITYLKEMLQ